MLHCFFVTIVYKDCIVIKFRERSLNNNPKTKTTTTTKLSPIVDSFLYQSPHIPIGYVRLKIAFDVLLNAIRFLKTKFPLD